MSITTPDSKRRALGKGGAGERHGLPHVELRCVGVMVASAEQKQRQGTGEKGSAHREILLRIDGSETERAGDLVPSIPDCSE